MRWGEAAAGFAASTPPGRSHCHSGTMTAALTHIIPQVLCNLHDDAIHALSMVITCVSRAACSVQHALAAAERATARPLSRDSTRAHLAPDAVEGASLCETLTHRFL
jgi:hypothetical protein